MSISLQNVSLTIGAEPIIRDVSLTFEAGTMNVLLGPTLSGKTSLMRLMAGLDRPTAGRIVEDGKDVTGMPVRQRSVAMVYQQFVNYPTLSVYENLASPLRRCRARRQGDRKPRTRCGSSARARADAGPARRCSFPAASNSASPSAARW